ncbi:MAG TPA: hypothetical protein VM537_09365, partial [Anaerolineae bacterium]|nr:hypothetical protein [Anaerolineae bacterium]
ATGEYRLVQNGEWYLRVDGGAGQWTYSVATTSNWPVLRRVESPEPCETPEMVLRKILRRTDWQGAFALYAPGRLLDEIREIVQQYLAESEPTKSETPWDQVLRLADGYSSFCEMAENLREILAIAREQTDGE